MDKNLNEMIIANRRELDKEIKDSTLKMYIANIKKVSKTLNDGVETGGYEWLKDTEKVKTFFEQLTRTIKGEDTPRPIQYTTIRNYYNAIIMYLYALNSDGKADTYIENYTKYRDELNKKYEDDQATGNFSETQDKNMATMEEIHQIISDIGVELKNMKLKDKPRLKREERTLLQIYLILNIHVVAPLRNDLAGMKIIKKRIYNSLTNDDKKETNYLVLNKNKMFFCLNDYKTSRKYSEKCIEIPDDLRKVLRFYLSINNSEYLLTKMDGKPMTRNYISQLLTKYFKNKIGKSISTTLLRKVYLTHKYSDIKEEMERDADLMGHSVAIAQKVYVKKRLPVKEESDESDE
tara:strand:- start:781 stop:1827 length:1047 start_codon:yes stop_codon:yes gene_type:complete